MTEEKKIMEKYIPIELMGMFDYWIHHVAISREKMTAYVAKRNNHLPSHVVVVDACLACRVLDEGKRLKLLRDHQFEKNQIFECIQSDFIIWFLQENLGMYNDDEMNLRHFLITDENYMIDVLSAFPPSFQSMNHIMIED